MEVKSVQLSLFPLLAAPWCAPIKIKHGDVSCRTPRGENYRNVMGTRCKIRCKQGYEAQSSEVVCMASKHWSSNYACRGKNQHLPLSPSYITSLTIHIIMHIHTPTYRFLRMWTLYNNPLYFWAFSKFYSWTWCSFTCDGDFPAKSYTWD